MSLTSALNTSVNALSINGISFVDDSVRVSTGGALFQPLLGGVYASGARLSRPAGGEGPLAARYGLQTVQKLERTASGPAAFTR